MAAQQIQKLAEQSNSSAAQIGANIQELVDKTEGIVKAMSLISNALRKQEESVDQTKRIFDELNESIGDINQKEMDMQKNVTDMNQAKDSMSRIIAGLADSAEENEGIIEKSNGCKYNTIKSIYDLKMGKETDIYVDDQADF